MSETSEVLRRAANQLRGDASVGYQRGHIAMREVRFKRGVADWLDGCALFEEARDEEEWLDLDGDPIAPEDTHAIGSALKVARAYLGADQ
jgi:hypothetical protein